MSAHGAASARLLHKNPLELLLAAGDGLSNAPLARPAVYPRGTRAVLGELRQSVTDTPFHCNRSRSVGAWRTSLLSNERNRCPQDRIDVPLSSPHDANTCSRTCGTVF